jgi:hypothetical protein
VQSDTSLSLFVQGPIGLDSAGIQFSTDFFPMSLSRFCMRSPNMMQQLASCVGFSACERLISGSIHRGGILGTLI